VLNDPCVSRHHAVIVRKGDTYTVIDQNSTHGTFLNAMRVEVGVSAGRKTVVEFGAHRGERDLAN
jgi:pSer/pThr/pTyr-binding forkhead associated (FHA) protein